MNSNEPYSDELSSMERELLAAFVVPSPSSAMEEKVMARLGAYRGRRNTLRRYAPIAMVGLVAAAIFLVVRMERAGPLVEKNVSKRGSTTEPAATRPEPSWQLTGSDRDAYEVGMDAKQLRNGRATRFIRSVKVSEGFGTWKRKINVQQYRGKRVRLSAVVKTKSVAAWAGLWMRVNVGDEAVAFDNMANRPLRGDGGWSQYEVILDVSAQATSISYGVLLSGLGAVWFDDMRIEVVPETVLTTDAVQDGWSEGDSPDDNFDAYLDLEVRHRGEPTRFLGARATAGNHHGTLAKSSDGLAYRGKRVRFSAYVRTEAVENWAGLWMRVDVEDGVGGKATMVALDNMEERPILGSTDWTRYEIVLDVDARATSVVYGAILKGQGKLWFHDPVLEIVSEHVPTTK